MPSRQLHPLVDFVKSVKSELEQFGSSPQGKQVEGETRKLEEQLEGIETILTTGRFGKRKVKPHSALCNVLFKLPELGVEPYWIRFNDVPAGPSGKNEKHIGSEPGEPDDLEHQYFDELIPYTETESNPEGNRGNMMRVRLSLLTENLFEYEKKMSEILSEMHPDSQLFADLVEDYGFRPFFFSFIADIDEAADEALTEKLGQLGSGWYPTRTPGEDGCETLAELVGFVERSASPIEFHSFTLVISDNRLGKDKQDDLNKRYNADARNLGTTKDFLIEKDLNAVLSGTDLTLARVYSVGHGNCIRLTSANPKSTDARILYDVGFAYRHVPKRAPTAGGRANKSAQAIRNLKPHMVILSHWDADHYYGCAFASADMFDCTWLAPSFQCYAKSRKIPANAARLAAYLDYRKKLMLVHKDDDKRIVFSQDPANANGSLMVICQGSKGKNDSRITMNNRLGLTISIEPGPNASSERETLLMTGDVPYSSLSPHHKAILQKCHYLVVPHHGSKMEYVDLPAKSTTKSHAIICVESPSEVHKGHRSALNSADFEITHTCDADPPNPPGLAIDIDMRNSDAVTPMP